jgi:GDPmannose 4,6-dehydratase
VHAGVRDWEPLVEVHADFIRPADPSLLVGDATVAHEQLGWSPTVGFEDLVGRMVDAEPPV